MEAVESIRTIEMLKMMVKEGEVVIFQRMRMKKMTLGNKTMIEKTTMSPTNNEE